MASKVIANIKNNLPVRYGGETDNNAWAMTTAQPFSIYV